jgi:bla regulator protein BlaR1
MSPVDTLLTWLTAATVRGSILILVIVTLQSALGRWMSARWRFALWLPAVLVLAAPLLPECAWSAESKVVGRVVTSSWCCPSASRDCQPGAASAVDAVAGRAQTGWSVMAACWLLGAGWFLGVVLWSHARLIRRLRLGAQAPERDIAELVGELAEATGLRRIPEVLVCESMQSPAVAGLWRATLFLPKGFPGALTREETRLVLEHELLHVRRRDVWKNWGLCLLQAVHWFNPVAWLAVNKMRLDCEQVCDEEILARNGEECWAEYSYALIKVTGGFEQAETQIGMLGVAAATGLRTRLRALGQCQRRHPAWTLVWIGLIGLILVAGATRSANGLPKGVSMFGGGPSPAVARAQSIVLPRVELRGASVQQAVEYLQSESRAADPKGKGVRIWLTPEAAASARGQRITISMRGVTAWQALSALTGQAQLGMDGNGSVICVKWPFVTLNWPVHEADLLNLGYRQGMPAHEWLKQHGVDFPAGSFAELRGTPPSQAGEADRRLTVRNSQENLQRIGALLSVHRNFHLPSQP